MRKVEVLVRVTTVLSDNPDDDKYGRNVPNVVGGISGWLSYAAGQLYSYNSNHDGSTPRVEVVGATLIETAPPKSDAAIRMAAP